MTLHDANRCLCAGCLDYRARVLRARRRMNLRPIYSPAAATREAAVGGTTSSPSAREAETARNAYTPGAYGSEPPKGWTPTSSTATGEDVPAPAHVGAVLDATSGRTPGDHIAASRAVPTG